MAIIYMSRSPSFVSNLPPVIIFEKNPDDHET